jgi:hypothetical protein
VLTDIAYAKELRLFKTRYRELREQIRTGKLALTHRRVWSDLFAQALSTAALFGSLAEHTNQLMELRDWLMSG